MYGGITLCALTFQLIPLFYSILSDAPSTPYMPQHIWFGLYPFRSPLLRISIFLSFPAGTKMFQFPAFAPPLQMVPCLQHGGLPHSDISGSSLVCKSPELFAAVHVLLRLEKPRHPPFALCNFFTLSCSPLTVYTSSQIYIPSDSLFLPLSIFSLIMSNNYPFFSQTGCKGNQFLLSHKLFLKKIKTIYYFFLNIP